MEFLVPKTYDKRKTISFKVLLLGAPTHGSVDGARPSGCINGEHLCTGVLAKRSHAPVIERRHLRRLLPYSSINAFVIGGIIFILPDTNKF